MQKNQDTSFSPNKQAYIGHFIYFMLETVRQTIQKFALVKSESLVIGVSGGADSLVLLHILQQLASYLEITIYAATLDHQLRGEESVGDVHFVEQICLEWGVPLSVGQADVRTIARENQLGIEAAARLARYDFLAQVAQTVGASKIAVAHHADDQAETVLMHLLRGAGVHGLAGMALKSTVPNHMHLTLIRPLLGVTRAEIEAYCRQYHFEPRHDSTNDDTTLLRNGIRLDVLPFLAGYSPHVGAALARFAEIAAVEDDYLTQQVQQFTESDAVTVEDQRVSIVRLAFRGLHSALQRRVVLWALQQITIPEDISAQLTLEAVEIGLRGQQGAIALLGSGWRLRVDYDTLNIESVNTVPQTTLTPLLVEGFDQALDVPSIVNVGQFALHISHNQPSNAQPYGRLAIPTGARLQMRTRKMGDTFAPLGMNGHKQKLNRWFVNAKISRIIRDQLPLLVVDETIAAIYVNDQWSISESFAVRNTVEQVIYFQFLQNS